jgi:hypothetical protein
MGNEAIIIPIVIDPKAGVAGLKAVGDQAAKTNSQMGGAASSTGKFGDAMKGAARNALTMLGAMNLAQGAVKILVEGLIDAFKGHERLASSAKLLQEAQTKAVASTMEEVVQLQTLYAVAKDTTLSYGQRQAAIDKLNKQYPELHKNLTLETIGNDNVAKSIQAVINNLVKKAQLQNIIGTIAELSNKLAAMQEVYDKIGSSPIKRQIGRDIDDLKDRITTLTDAAVKLQGTTLTPKSSASFLGGLATGEAAVKVKELKIKPDKVKFDLDEAENEISKSLAAALQEGIEDYSLIRLPKKKYTLESPGSAATNENIGNDAFADMLQKQRELMEMNERIASQVSGLLTPAFGEMFEAILSKEDGLKAFFSAIGNSVKQLIKQLIQAAIQAAVLSLISGGAAKGGFSFLGAFKKITGFAEGGLVTGPVSALIGEGRGTNASNPEVVAPLDKLKTFFSNMLQTNRGFMPGSAMGVSGSVISMPAYVELRAKGRDLNGLLALENKSQGRTG